ncbi:MAG TPA: hypothetical protein VFT84_11180, partial [Gemmatimonadales bacterium]|nr:hypothetical protein [Gemmatimonadales bacterium]
MLALEEECMPVQSCRRRLLEAVLLVGLAVPGLALRAQQDPADSLAPVVSLGLPTPYRFYTGVGAGVEMAGEASVGITRAMLGGSRDITNPVPGLAGVAAEAWLGTRGEALDGGARLLFAMNAAGLQVGADYSLGRGRTDLVVTVLQPLRRGGILLPGGGLRVDWMPGRAELDLSFSAPVGARRPGRTRPRVPIAVALPAKPRPRPVVALDPELRHALADLRRAGGRVADVVTPYLPPGEPRRSGAAAVRLRQALDAISAPAPGSLVAVDAIHQYHAALRRAFADALGFDGVGEPPATVAMVGDIARRMLLDDVLIPYDQYLGQIRHRQFSRGLRARAEERFAGWVAAVTLVPDGRKPEVAEVYRRLLDLVDETIDSARTRWGDSRYIWVPLQLALTPEEHDTQTEIDALVERITGIALERGHDLIYATDERFEPALQRSILQASDYHVLWVHDFAGRNPDHAPDTVSHQVVEAYLTALTTAAASFDRTRRIPTFIVFMDQYYFGRSRSAWWLRLLADPLGHRVDLPGRNPRLERAVRDSQRRLREAVAQSAGLQEERRRRGEKWLRGTIAVHVNITHPPDPSFRGPRAPGVLAAGLTDDIMRDHRKVAFADITERDPSRGVAILTGLGIGEHYARFQWLDRTLIVRGRAAVTLKSEARALLRSQGFAEAEIPLVLRPDSAPPDLAERVAALEAGGWRARVGIAMNAPGYGPKRATAAKAALYTLLPAGCTIVAADPQWLSRFWGGLLLGSAIRGCRVLVIGPGPRNAPFSTSFAQYTLQRDLFHRLMTARDTLR